MEEPLPEGGQIRKLWIAEADLYREHLLRLDPKSRRSRFAGAVSNEFLRKHAQLGAILNRARLNPYRAAFHIVEVTKPRAERVKHGIGAGGG